MLFTADLRAFSAEKRVKPEVHGIKSEGMWGDLKPDDHDGLTKRKIKEGDEIPIKNEPTPEIGSQRALAGDDVFVAAAEQLFTARKTKRRRVK